MRCSFTSQDSGSPGKGLSTHKGVFKAIGLVLLLLCVLGACCVYWTVRAQRSVSDTKHRSAITSKSREIPVSHACVCFAGMLTTGIQLFLCCFLVHGWRQLFFRKLAVCRRWLCWRQL